MENAQRKLQEDAVLHGPSGMRRAILGAHALGALAFFIVSALAASYIFFLIRGEKSKFLASRLEYLSVVADLKAESIRSFHQERLLDVSVYAANLRLPQDYQTVLQGNAEMARRLAAALKPVFDSGRYLSVAILDRRGRVLSILPPDSEPPRPSAGPAGSPRLIKSHRNTAGKIILDYEASLNDGARLIFRARNAAWFSPLVKNWLGVEKTAETLLFQREAGSLLLLNKLVDEKNSNLSFLIPLDSDTIAARAARGESSPMLGFDYRRVPCYAAARDLPELGWILVTKIDENELLAPLRDKIQVITLASIGTFALIAGLLMILLRTQAGRLRADADADRLLLSTAIEQAGESVIITDKDAHILYTNPAFTRATGYSRKEVMGEKTSILKSGHHDDALYKTLWQTLARGDIWKGRFVNRRKNGTFYEEDATITPVRDHSGSIEHYVAVKRDVSEIKSLETQLLHSQKMEAIGRLAGGIAHDFNNILTTINGYSEILADSAPPDSPLAADLAEILGAGRRAAILTRQLLTFSRRAPSDPVVLDLCVPVRAMEKMLRRTLGEDVSLTLDLPAEPLWVRTDPGQIDQILLNLAINARDAMPHGGKLRVRTHATDFKTDEILMLEVVQAGRYATLLIEDDGIGMDRTVLAHLFEPFFTTKEKGKGTGLGLATVFGIVKQNKGHISVASAPGRGTTFTVHLPLTAAPVAEALACPAKPAVSHRGDETILIVEDQDSVLRMVERALIPQGYRVIACNSPAKALAAALAVEGPIHLLLTDVVMPGMDGEELAVHLREVRPETRVLYMSGYTDGRLDTLGEASTKVDLLLKPFTAEQVCRRVRDALDGAAPHVG